MNTIKFNIEVQVTGDYAPSEKVVKGYATSIKEGIAMDIQDAEVSITDMKASYTTTMDLNDQEPDDIDPNTEGETEGY